jgi:hypothetical protein
MKNMLHSKKKDRKRIGRNSYEKLEIITGFEKYCSLCCCENAPFCEQEKVLNVVII